MKRSGRIILIGILLVIGSCSGVIAQQVERTLRLGVVFDGPWERNKEILSLLNREITDALAGQGMVVVSDDKVLVGDWTIAGAARMNSQLLSDKGVDLVIGFGVFASQDLCKRAQLGKPVIAPIVIDPVRQQLPNESGTSGVKNLAYLVFPQTFLRDFTLIRELTSVKKLVFLTSRRYHEGIPATRATDDEIGRLIGTTFVTVRFDDHADDALAAIPPDADAVYLDIVPLSSGESEKLVNGLIARRLPSFSMAGETEVRRGIMAAANPDIFPRLIRRIAMNVHRIFLGEDPGTLPVTFPAGRRLFINLKTAFAVGVSPKWNTLLEAELIQLDSSAVAGAQPYTFATALQRIADENLDVQAKFREVSAGAENVGIARSALLPKIDFSATGLQIDQDRAQAGMQPERRGTFDVGGTQVLFSEPALANVSIQSSLQDSRESDLELTRLNAVTDGAATYLNYLRTRKSYYILLDNLKLTRSNLELAQIRQSTGAAGPEEPLRWEVEIASLRKSVMDTYSQMNQVLLALKQAMNVPLIYIVNIEDVSLEDTSLFLSNKKLLSYLEDPLSFNLLTDVLVQEGIARSNELRQLDAVITAQQRSLSSARYSLFLPTVAAFAGYTNTYYKSTVNSPFQLTNLPAPPSSLPPELPVYLGQLFSAVSPRIPDRNDWNVGIQLSFNLFQGFSTSAHEEQASETLQQYRVQRAAVQDKVALRVRAQMESVKAAYFAIQQSHLEQQAAGKGLELVTEAYSRGAVPILSLLDAQNSSLRADLVAANTFYDFFVAYIQLERAIGQIDILMTPEARQQVLDRVLQAMKTALKN
ncbi:MAG TPA: TolC family protein [Bacteroidota bacterium]